MTGEPPHGPRVDPPLVLARPPSIAVAGRGYRIEDRPTARLDLEPYGFVLLTPDELQGLAAQALATLATMRETRHPGEGSRDDEP